MNITDFKTNPDLEKKGIWKDHMDARFLVASLNNPKYQKEIRRLTQQLPPGKAKDPEVIEDILAQAAARHILLSYEGDVNENGTPLPCTPENRLKLCRIRAFREWLLFEAQDTANFQQEGEQEEISSLKSGPDVASNVE